MNVPVAGTSEIRAYGWVFTSPAGSLTQVFLAVFATEMVLKMIAMGVVMTRGSYFRDPVRGTCVCFGVLSPTTVCVSSPRHAVALVGVNVMETK